LKLLNFFFPLLTLFLLIPHPSQADEILLQADEILYEEPEKTTATGNVILTFSAGILKTNSLTYTEKEGGVEIPGDFTFTATHLSLHGKQLSFSIPKEEGEFSSASGSYQVTPEFSLFFSGKKGKMKQRELTLEEVELSNFSPVKKAGSRMFVRSARLYQQGQSRYLSLKKVQVYLFGQKVFYLPGYTHRIPNGERAGEMEILPYISFHRDAGAMAGFLWEFPVNSLSLTSAQIYAHKIGHLPSLSLFREYHHSFRGIQEETRFRLTYGKDFRINEFGRGSEVLYQPSVSILSSYRYASLQMDIHTGWVSVEERYVPTSAHLPQQRFQYLQVSGKKRVLAYKRSTFYVASSREWNDFQAGHRVRWVSRLGFHQKLSRGEFSLGYLTAEHRGSAPFFYLLTRERDTLFASFQHPLLKNISLYVELEYDLNRKNLYRDVYELAYDYRGLVIHTRLSPRFAGVNLYFSLKGL